MALSFVPLVALALLQCLATLRGTALPGYAMVISIGLCQAVEIALRRRCLKTVRVHLPISYEVRRRWATYRAIALSLRITAIGSGLAWLIAARSAARTPTSVSLIALTLATFWIEHRVQARAAVIHRIQPDAVTLRIPDITVPDEFLAPPSKEQRKPAFELYHPGFESAQQQGMWFHKGS